MADTNDVITLAEAKSRLGIPTADTNHDVSIASVVSGVSGQLDRLVGPVVTRTVTSEAHDGGRKLVGLAYRPVDSVTTVTEYDGVTSTSLTEQTAGTAPSDGFSVDAGGVIRRLSTGSDDTFPAGRNNVVVTYEAGRYADTASVTSKFKEACLLMLRNVWTSELASGSQTFGGMTDGFTNPLLGPGLLNKVVAMVGREQDRPLV